MVRPHIRFAEIALGMRAAFTKVQVMIHPPLEGGSKFAIRKFRGGVMAPLSRLDPPRKTLLVLSALPQGEGRLSNAGSSACVRPICRESPARPMRLPAASPHRDRCRD